MATSHSKAQAKYDSTHCKYYSFKFNLEFDADIIKQLSKVVSKQGYIKQLIREDISTNTVPKKRMSLDEIYEFLQGQTNDYDGSMYELLNALTNKHLNG